MSSPSKKNGMGDYTKLVGSHHLLHRVEGKAQGHHNHRGERSYFEGCYLSSTKVILINKRERTKIENLERHNTLEKKIYL